MNSFKNRSHFCNYCRKILSNKCLEYSHHTINVVIWEIWDSNSLELKRWLINELSNCKQRETVKLFNNQLREIKSKFELLK